MAAHFMGRSIERSGRGNYQGKKNRELAETPYNNIEIAEAYPLIFTSWKSSAYRHSGGRQIDSLRTCHPEPMVYLHP